MMAQIICGFAVICLFSPIGKDTRLIIDSLLWARNSVRESATLARLKSRVRISPGPPLALRELKQKVFNHIF